MLVICFFEKGVSKYLKCYFISITGLPAQAQNELATRLSFEETVEFLQAVVFVLCQALPQSVEVKVVKKNKHTQYQGCDVIEEIMRKRINDQQLCSQAIISEVTKSHPKGDDNVEFSNQWTDFNNK